MRRSTQNAVKHGKKQEITQNIEWFMENYEKKYKEALEKAGDKYKVVLIKED